MLPAPTVFYSAQTPLRMRPWCPPFANCAKDGAPGDFSSVHTSAAFFLRLTASLASMALMPTLRLQVKFSFTDCS
jgi:hypothetical protein